DENSQALRMLPPLLGQRSGVRANVSSNLILRVGGGPGPARYLCCYAPSQISPDESEERLRGVTIISGWSHAHARDVLRVSAAPLLASTPGDPRREFIRDPLRVLDIFAIEIDHVKAAVRSGGREDRMEPRIGRSEKLFSYSGALGDERGTLRHEPATLDEVVD